MVLTFKQAPLCHIIITIIIIPITTHGLDWTLDSVFINDDAQIVNCRQ